MLRIGIVGCGKIADDHLSQIKRIDGCEVVGVCDNEVLMAHQLADRFSVRHRFDSLDEMLSTISPDVVHITTPPASHFGLAKKCMQSGAHVYVEKPFTVAEQEARDLIAFAQENGRKLTVGHDDQFRHVARRMRELVRSEYLGTGPVHLESYYCYEMGGSSYAKALLANKQHWVRRLPGKLLQNVISHGIARISEFMTTDAPQVIAFGFASPYLRSLGEHEIIDEARIIVADDDRMTAYFTFSSQMRPALHQFRIYGSKNGLVLDQDQETLIKLRGHRYPSFAEKFIPPLDFAKQYLGNFVTNAKKFIARDFHMKAGMKYLIQQFYHSVEQDSSLPIDYQEILRTSVIMERIFRQLAIPQNSLLDGSSTTQLLESEKAV